MDLTTAYGDRPSTCTEPECDGQHYARGLCKRHYRRAHTAGLLEPLARKEPETEFRRLTDTSGGPDACWPWIGPLDAHGYGVLHASGTWKAHRYSLELHGTDLPDDLVVDHTCHNADSTCTGGATCMHRRCVNPAHLELTGRGENVRRSPVDRTRTHCVHGHPLSGDNLVIEKSGRRRCAECLRERGRRSRERRRQQQADAQQDRGA